MKIKTRIKIIQSYIEKATMGYNERRAFEEIIEILKEISER